MKNDGQHASDNQEALFSLNDSPIEVRHRQWIRGPRGARTKGLRLFS